MEKKEFEDEGFQAGYLLAMFLENRKCEIGCDSVCQNCIDKALQQAEEIISENNNFLTDLNSTGQDVLFKISNRGTFVSRV